MHKLISFTLFVLFSIPSYSFQNNYQLELKISSDISSDIAFALFVDKGIYGIDTFDALKLTSLSTNYAEIYTQDSTDRKLFINTLPIDLDKVIELPVYFRSTYEDTFLVSVNKFQDFPENWSLTLVDTSNTDTLELSSGVSVEVVHEGDFDSGILTIQHFVLIVNPGIETQEVSISGTSGKNGWRFLGSPYSDRTYEELLNFVWTQGAYGSNDSSATATVYTWNEAEQVFQTVTNFSDTLNQGLGFLAYLFEDDNPNNAGIDNGWPKSFQTSGITNFGTIDLPVSYSSGSDPSLDGFNLIANPYPFSIDWDAPSGWTKNNINDSIWIWDPNSNSGNGGYKVYNNGVGDDISVIAPNQAFWISAYDINPSISISEEVEPNTNGVLIKPQNKPVSNFIVNVSSSTGFKDALHISFREQSSAKNEKWDVQKLRSLSPNFLSISARKKQKNLAVQNFLYSSEDIEIHFEITSSSIGTAKLWLGNLSKLHQEFSFRLYDHQTETFSVLKELESFQFQLDSTALKFTLHLEYPKEEILEAELNAPHILVLNQNYPNPFNLNTRIDFTIPKQAIVRLEVFDVLGRKVITLIDEPKSTGNYSINFDASQLSNGLYFYHLLFEDKVLTRKMTLIK